MGNAHFVERRGKTGTDLDDVAGKAKELVKGNAGFVVEVVFLTGTANQLVHLLEAGVIAGNQDSVEVVTHSAFLTGAGIDVYQLLCEVDFTTVQIFQPSLITGDLFFYPLIDVA